MPLIYGIDFGTTNSLLGASDGKTLYPPVALDPHAATPSVLRSILYFPNMAKCFYGAQAISEFLNRSGEGRLIRSIKRYLPVRSFIGTWIEDRPMNLEDIIGLFLGEMRKRANVHFQQDVDSVVLGRPARFSADDAEDEFAQFRLEQGARKAGFKHIEFCPEPIAAAFEFRAGLTEEKIVLVGDFGGGTSDFTVMRMKPGTYDPKDVLAVGGVAVAGDALDGAVMRSRLCQHFGADVAFTAPFGKNVLRMPAHLMGKICSPADISLLLKRDSAEFLQNVRKWAMTEQDRQKIDRLFTLVQDQLGFSLFESIEQAKRNLSQGPSTVLEYDYPGIEIREPIAREQFDGYTASQVNAIMGSLDSTLALAGVVPSQIDLVCSTGGTAKVPAILEGLQARFGKDKIQQHNHFHSVVQGLTRRAQMIAS